MAQKKIIMYNDNDEQRNKRQENRPPIKIGVSLMVGGFAIGTIGGIFINDVFGWIGLGAIISGIVITYFYDYFS